MSGFTGNERATAFGKDANGTECVIYHNTVVASIDRDGVVTLNTGGYNTVTTKRRMNQFFAHHGLRYTVYQSNYQWYVDHPDWDRPHQFDDRARFDKTGPIIN